MNVLFVLLLGTASAYPEYLVCNDPRFNLGYTIMGQVVKPSTSAGFHASSSSYTANSSITLSYGNLGVDGAFVAVRALPQQGYLGQYGSFSKLSQNLNFSEGSCPNTVFSTNPTPTGSLTWTSTKDTYGPVDFTLLFGTPSEVHSVVITVSGPPMPSTPPPLQEKPRHETAPGYMIPAQGLSVSTSDQGGKCVAPTDGSYNLPNSPVFVQKLRRKSVTFPTEQCIPCREDYLDTCESVVVQCPSEPGALATQKLFLTHNCTGKARISLLPTQFVHCPGVDYYSPDYLDLSRFVHKLQRDHPNYFPDEALALTAIAEYRKMLHVIQKFPDFPAVPSKLVDLVWHEHILDTQTYRLDSQRLFGKYLHHAPTFGADEDESVQTEKTELRKQQQEMLRQYLHLFGEEPDASIWPQLSKSPQMGAGRLPDCCAAQCVKPGCVTCSGCNAILCGKLQDSAEREAIYVLPDHFAGFVPYLGQSSASDMTYLCTGSPMQGMNVSWTISGDHIYVKQSLKGESWQSMGFTNVAPYNMGFSDYIVALYGGAPHNNYTGIRDLYKYDAGNHYPCFDVLEECSLDGKKGTMDIKDGVVAREDGISTATWNRLLITPDYKDGKITPSDMKVMFASGLDGHDEFVYHGVHGHITVTMNFFTGTMTPFSPPHM